nr:tyrosine-type recombinase/integrase [Bacillus sp. HNG]
MNIFEKVAFHRREKLYLSLCESQEDNDAAVFATERHPHRMSIAPTRYIIKRISKRAGINKVIYLHQLSHRYATHILNNGAPFEVIQSFKGHEKSETTRIFAELSGRLRKEFYQKYV